ncbi:TMAO reductase system periplasmic protein TorT [Pseudomonas sp. JS3066]|jgi:protein TorT|uniref:TMAO reductase system periplasmic protein TorT n=1 Tax=unclassified Pseudomonas TaxID=196821 RepID=UPI000EA8C610|nr:MULTISPECIES: TMAO reductase system periplasmic protein TorT [unclassified Pseudomonas]AYF88986.1 TMAO reductase system periplasmic protein TorT [Pseudomonas sp. DY-1]MDH4653180.1 TMAO reductase system periplasmic protein TorT [Pseudomonas sp. BN606]MRK21098.1 TMAO reductase system periplasmic protein TorT [Pseudomonas sp. JG-B]WVK93476.1 TMAO reductase system periplasmic protein TorT [Pseudomonas sp. JS3066]
MRTLCALLLSLMSAAPCLAAEWFPLQVEVDGRDASYRPLTGASKPWRICALLPHGMDRYWWGVAWGLDEEAQRQGIQLGVYEAGGYQFPDMQRAQLTRCIQLAADAYVIAAIGAKGLCDEIALLHRDKVPVIDLINRIDCPGITAMSQVDFADMAKAAMAYIRDHSGGRPVRVGWLPGPEDAGWVADAERGLKEFGSQAGVTLISGGYGPVDRSTQAVLVRQLLAREPGLDYILGNAEAAAFAGHLVRTGGSRYKAQVVSLYATERVLEEIADGTVLASPTDSPVIQARVAVDLAIRALEGKQSPQRVSPRIEVIDKDSLQRFDISRLMPPSGHWMIRQDLPE